MKMKKGVKIEMVVNFLLSFLFYIISMFFIVIGIILFDAITFAFGVVCLFAVFLHNAANKQ